MSVGTANTKTKTFSERQLVDRVRIPLHSLFHQPISNMSMVKLILVVKHSALFPSRIAMVF